MSAPAGSCKRSRADFEGAPAEADAATAPTEPSRSLLEELRVKVGALEVELAANRRFTNQAQQFVDREEAKLTLPVDEVLVEGMKEEIGKLRTADCTLLRQIRVLRTKRDGWMGWIEVKGVNPRLQFWVPNPRLKGGAKVEGHAVLHRAGGRAGLP
jgi:hypothetical protein